LRPARILVVDDAPGNITLLEGILESDGYDEVIASSGKEAIQRVYTSNVDLVLLDVTMPDMSGYEVCKTLRATPMTEILPVVMVTSRDAAQERMKGLEVGADDFLTTPINQAELLGRVRSLLRIKRLQDEVKIWNYELERRVQEQTRHLDRLNHLKTFFAPELIVTILSSGGEGVLRPHRREVTVMFMDLRGFTAFTDSVEPEEVTGLLLEYQAMVSPIATAHGGTLDSFAGDGMMIIFNDPLELENPEEQAVRMALAVHESFIPLREDWARRHFFLDLGIGIATGYATCGTFGIERRNYYTAIGRVCNLAARLCGEAKAGQTLADDKTYERVRDFFEADPVGGLTLKGFKAPIPAVDIRSMKVIPA
jgi:class 3 adenylate cyclase/CheY-like chemotaxis protein